LDKDIAYDREKIEKRFAFLGVNGKKREVLLAYFFRCPGRRVRFSPVQILSVEGRLEQTTRIKKRMKNTRWIPDRNRDSDALGEK
jgi:hypothetical protein